MGQIMIKTKLRWMGIGIIAAVSLTACGNGGGSGLGSIGSGFGSGGRSDTAENTRQNRPAAQEEERETIWDLFTNIDDPNETVEVNTYLWHATLEILNFLPVEAADPFSGVIVFGAGTPPGGGRSYRATVQITDPALDARSLVVSLRTSGGGAVDPDTVRAVEDAILTRARQLRIEDAGL